MIAKATNHLHYKTLHTLNKCSKRIYTHHTPQQDSLLPLSSSAHLIATQTSIPLQTLPNTGWRDSPSLNL
jgi:hypothetical protein